jgi:hypothetical protein
MKGQRSSQLDELRDLVSGKEPLEALKLAVATMGSREPGDLTALVSDAAERHCHETGEDHLAGDLQDALHAALQVLTTEQRAEWLSVIMALNSELSAIILDAQG